MTRLQIRRYFRHGTLTQLNTFEVVARLGSFSRAADELCLAQPTVSVHIKKLTQTIGLPLFKQAGMRVQLTVVGRELLAGCDAILHTLAQVEDKIAPLRNDKPDKYHAVGAKNLTLR
jgi:DNA-binding transcriptional LysR family regulator